MDFSLDNLYKLEKDVDSVFSGLFGAKWEEITKTAVMKLDKSSLSTLVLSAVSVLGKSKAMLRSAAVCVEGMNKEQIEIQRTLLRSKLQESLLKSNSDQIVSLQTTVEKEMRSFSDVVKQGCDERITATQVKAAVKSAVMDDDRRRTVMVFGLEERSNEAVQQKVEEMIRISCVTERPTVSDCFRVGTVRAGVQRPVKVVFQSSEGAAMVLRSARRLRDTRFSRVFISPDRTREEREERKGLVRQMKEKISSNPEQYHYISNGQVCSRDKVAVSTLPAAAAASTPSPRTTSHPSQPPSVVPQTTPRSTHVPTSNIRIV